MTLAEHLTDWVDWDAAAYHLARTLGLFPDHNFHQVKNIFWTDNDLGNGLHDALLALTRAHILDRREEPDEQFRHHHP
ncbi:MAG TPA: hypothetical protein VFW65_30280 [Pseudonocardiaceae bacterium]|nr:hypothetical protein [Pseudonocardiaceae bacterium]